MVSLHDIREHVASLFIMLNKKTVILFRIEFLVVLVTLLFFAMFLMDFYRRIIHNSFMRAVFSIFDAVSDSIVVYLLGAMQTAPFKNQLFPVWALVLVNFRYSADYISGYGVPDRRGRRFTEWRNVFKLLGSAFLNWTRGSSFSGPLWLVWGLQIVRSFYRFSSHKLASQAIWHGRSSELVAEHMRTMHEQLSSSSNSGGEAAMEGYSYLVYGETKHKEGDFKLKKPQYALSLSTDRQQNATKIKDGTKTSSTANSSPRLIKLNMFWKQKVEQGNNKAVTKDLPLAFALSRLIRCRFEDVTLQQPIFGTNRKLVKSIVAGKVVGASNALRIMELQLAFVHDYFNTRYPMVFWCGIPSLFFSLLLSVLTMGAVFWLGVDIRKVYMPPRGEFANLVKGFNVDTIITWLFLVLMIIKEMWEIFTYLHSDWTRLIMACEYVQHKLCESMKESADTWKERVLLYFSRSSKITGRRWHGFIDQYVFLESYDDRPRFWNLIHNLTTGIVPKKEDGAKLGSAVQVPGCVRKAVLKKLKELTKVNGDDGQAGRTLPGFIKTLSKSNTNLKLSNELQRYRAYTAPPSSATTGVSDIVVLPTASHIILAWHIATNLCEMELATKCHVDLGSPGFPCSLFSWFSSLCSSKTYLLDVDDKKGCKGGGGSGSDSDSGSGSSSKSNDETEEKKQMSGKLRRRYIIANSLSRYCAYLLVSKPDLIPDSFLVPNKVFQQAVKSARDGIFEGTGSLQERKKALEDIAGKAKGTQAHKEDSAETDEEDVLKQGAVLGMELLRYPTEEGRWKILADVWTELLIHIAPTLNVQAHRKCLSAGEFITHIWALLWHCDIQRSSLWPKDTGTGDSKPKPQVEDGGDRAAAEIENRQTGGVRERDHIEIPIDEADNKEKEKKGTKELEAGDSSTTGTGQLRMEGTGSSEIEEVHWHSTRDVQKGMVGRAQNEQQ